jgi:hypothetical protein
MSTSPTRLAVEKPRRMRTLQRDARGYPVPFLVLIDRSGTPQFTINDARRTAECVSKRLCAICGKRFDRGEMWFVGGSRCFLHTRGAFVDPPVHLECGEYALKVCPFLAMPSYSKRIDDRKLAPDGLPEGMVTARHDHMLPAHPERFGFGCTHGYRLVGPMGQHLFVVDQWDYVEWWRNGAVINAPDGCPSDAEWERFGT